MKYFIFSLVVVTALASCNQPNGHRSPEAMKARLDSLKNELLQTDIAFSQLCEEKGRNVAFIEYAADDATVLRPFSMPVTGRDSIASLLKQHPDSLYSLKWLPIRSDVARSGDIGYTYGTYTVDVKNIGKEEGTYCTVWKREKGKSWKFVMDTGNEGLSAADKTMDKKIDAKEKKEEKHDEAMEKKKKK